MEIDAKKIWNDKINKELPIIKALLLDLGYELDEIQPNLMGEKFLMKIDKFVLSAVRIADGKKVIVKVSKDKNGIQEITADRDAMRNLKKMSFALDTIKIAEEYYFDKVSGYTVFIVEFLDQKESMMKLPLEEQFYVTLRAFDILENIYLATKEHKKEVAGKFTVLTAKDYLKKFLQYRDNINKILNDPEVDEKISTAKNMFKENMKAVERYENFFVHEDFVQQNFRFVDNILYFIDHEALQFGNLYETQARYLNFMLIYSPSLERKYMEYFKKKHEAEEDKIISLKMMRMLKCTQLLDFYAKSLEKTDGKDYELSKARFSFWLDVLENLMNDTELHHSILTEMITTRDRLRSPEEIERQKMIKHL